MPVEFLGIAGTNPASEVTPRSGGPLDLEYTTKLARAHEDNGWDRILFAYHSGSPDPAQVAAYVAGRTERINLVVAHRPNVAYLTGGGGNSTALVGTPDTVAAALLDYYDLGIRIFSARGYDIYDDAIDFGRYVIPLVRSEVAHREQRKAS
jgi:alkanesulfonate monooxygenase SsuD/methylene tetrahydromethanopterin reductase-like flavin-dependent oxidoreductase (luciferase family)